MNSLQTAASFGYKDGENEFKPHTSMPELSDSNIQHRILTGGGIVTEQSIAYYRESYSRGWNYAERKQGGNK